MFAKLAWFSLSIDCRPMEGRGSVDRRVCGIIVILKGFAGDFVGKILLLLILGVTEPLPEAAEMMAEKVPACRNEATCAEKPFCDELSSVPPPPGVLGKVGVVLEELSLAIKAAEEAEAATAMPGCSFFSLILLISSAPKLVEEKVALLFVSRLLPAEVPEPPPRGVSAPGVPEDLLDS